LGSSPFSTKAGALGSDGAMLVQVAGVVRKVGYHLLGV
jgi:hypothetical protein